MAKGPAHPPTNSHLQTRYISINIVILDKHGRSIPSCLSWTHRHVWRLSDISFMRAALSTFLPVRLLRGTETSGSRQVEFIRDISRSATVQAQVCCGDFNKHSR
jgi:hypothetical protein